MSGVAATLCRRVAVKHKFKVVFCGILVFFRGACLEGLGSTQFRYAGSLTPRHKGTVCGDDEYAPINLGLLISTIVSHLMKGGKLGNRDRVPGRGLFVPEVRAKPVSASTQVKAPQ